MPRIATTCCALALRTLLAVCSVTQFLSACRAEPPSPANSRSVEELRAAYRSLLQGKEDAHFSALRESADDGIALQAFWEGVKRDAFAIYIEACAAVTGKNIFRFGTLYVQ